MRCKHQVYPGVQRRNQETLYKSGRMNVCKILQSTRHLSHVIKILLAVVSLCLYISEVNADVLLFGSTKQDQIFTGIEGVSTAFVKLNALGATKLSFTTTAPNQRVIITFSASCVIEGPNPQLDFRGFSFINILVDPAGPVGEFTAPPTDNVETGSVLCIADGSNHNGVSATVVASAKPAQAGVNTVRVRLGISPAPATVLLFGTSLAVVR
jgi:hypothetical protein